MQLSRTIPPNAQAENLSAREIQSKTIGFQRKLLLALGVTQALMALGYAVLLPLKESIPYIVTVDKKTGEANATVGQVATQYEPSEDTVLWFVRRWLTATYSIHPVMSKSIFEPTALSMLRGNNAIGKFKAFRSDDKTADRLAADPTLTREVAIDSITPVAGSTRGVVATLTLTTASRGEITTRRILVTVFYEIIKSTEAADRISHPIGLFIVDFKADEGK